MIMEVETLYFAGEWELAIRRWKMEDEIQIMMVQF
jgi:hypothetical protein